MSTVNKAILLGKLGEDPYHRTLGGISIVTFPLVTKTNFKKDGRVVEDVEWHNIIIWRDAADAAFKVLKKGKLVYLEGRLQTRNFEKDGINRYTTEVIVSNFTLIGRASDFES